MKVEGYKDEYLKLMTMYALLLAQSAEDPIVSDYSYDVINDTLTDSDIDYEESKSGVKSSMSDSSGSSAENSALLSGVQSSGIYLNGLMSVFSPFNWLRKQLARTRDENNGAAPITMEQELGETLYCSTERGLFIWC